MAKKGVTLSLMVVCSVAMAQLRSPDTKFIRDLPDRTVIGEYSAGATLECASLSAELLSIRCNDVRLRRDKLKIKEERYTPSGEKKLTLTARVGPKETAKYEGYCQCFAWKLNNMRRWEPVPGNKGYFVQQKRGRPSKPRITRISNVTSTSLYVHWQLPEQPNGEIVGYKVQWNRRWYNPRRYLVEVETDTRVVTGLLTNPMAAYISGLKPNTGYTITVTASTSEGWGDVGDEVPVYTGIAEPDTRHTIAVTASTNGGWSDVGDVVPVKTDDAAHSSNRIFQNLVDYVKAQSRPDVIPQTALDEPVKLELEVALINIRDVDQDNNLVELDAWLKLKWNSTITFSPSEFDDLKSVRIPASNIWLPDVATYHDAEMEIAVDSLSSVAILYSDGHVVWVPKSTIRVVCDVAEYNIVTNATCRFRIGSWTYSAENLVLGEDSSFSDQIDGNSSKYEVLATSAKRETKTFPCCSDAYENVLHTLSFRGKPKIPEEPWQSLIDVLEQ